MSLVPLRELTAGSLAGSAPLLAHPACRSHLSQGGTGRLLPWPPHPERHAAAVLREEPDGILHLYRRLIALRRDVPALRRGALEPLDAPPGVLAYRRTPPGPGDPAATVVVNFADAPRRWQGAGELLLASWRTGGVPPAGPGAGPGALDLPPFGAAVLLDRPGA